MKKLFLSSLAVMAIFSLTLISCEDNLQAVIPCDNGNLVFFVDYDTTAGLNISQVQSGAVSTPISDFEVTIDGQVYSNAQLQSFSPVPGTEYDICATYIPQPNCSECIVYVADSVNTIGGGSGGGNSGGTGGGNNGGSGGTGGGPAGGGSVVSSGCGTILMTAALDSSGVSNFQGILNQASISGSFSWTLNGASVSGAQATSLGSSINLQVVSGDVVCVILDCGQNMFSESCFTVQ